MLKDAGLKLGTDLVPREARSNDIQHNKFMVLLKGAAQTPTEVWTGSTNLSLGGIHGQTNVGHWVRNAAVAASFRDYWKVLSADPGGKDGDDTATKRQKNEALRKATEAIQTVPGGAASIPKGVTPLFSPRTKLDALNLYVELVDKASELACITLAFGIGKAFKDQLKDNTGQSHLSFLLLEKRDKPTATNKDTFVYINSRQNVYKAWGAYIRDPVYQWTRETNAMGLGLNKHVSYIHSKFLLRDPLGADPIVVTGSANFSEASTTANDENMLIIRGNKRVADIYFTEFNRLFNHYYFRSVLESLNSSSGPSAQPGAGTDPDASLFLSEDGGWLKKYKPGTLRQKRVTIYRRMKI